ncbi:MAG: filamentous hemagglutinin N-terminal domain-containing protein [Desulfobacterales bacterium]|nr:filamentous hemagglutinin N-terminal domain-containing protein [Desulfobacterales bacterium]
MKMIPPFPLLDSQRNASLISILMSLIILFCAPPELAADVATDGTVGPAQSLAGPNYQIPQTLGTTSGGNLFHSFERFGLNSDESATFTGSNFINNVISRVTGGEASTIDGLLRSQVGQANFFFINPAGVFFGPNAQVDVPAAFHVSTADELRFDDGNVFSATDLGKSTLSIATPVNFGYLSPQPASIVLKGSRLTFAPSSEVSLDGGDVTIKGADNQEASLVSEGGEIRLTAMGDQTGTVFLENSGFEKIGGKVLIEAARVDASGAGGGRVTLGAGDARISAATVSANNDSDIDDIKGGVEIAVNGLLRIDRGSRVESNAFGAGDSGCVKVKAASLQIEQEEGERLTGLFSEVEPAAIGNAAGIAVDVEDTISIQGVGTITSSTWGNGNAGPVRIDAGDVLFDGEGRGVSYREKDFIAGISSETAVGSEGNAGEVSISAKNQIYINNVFGISSCTNGMGDAGNVRIEAGELRIELFSGILSATGMGSKGNAGTVEVTVDGLLEVLNGAFISSDTYAQGDAGSVTVKAGDLKIEGRSNITSQANLDSSGKAGTLEVTVDGQLEVLNGSAISSSTFSAGDAGSVTVNAGELRIELFSGILSATVVGSTGKAGTVEVTVDGLLEVLNGAFISSGTDAQGDAGSVTVNAGELRIKNGSGILSRAGTGSSGNAGAIDVSVAGLLELNNNSRISSSTYSAGAAGSVTVNAGDLKIEGMSNITSQANQGSSGKAGTVEVAVNGLLEVLNGAFISSDTYAEGDAGSVTVKAGDLKIEGAEGRLARIASKANPGSTSNAGMVNVSADGGLELLNFAEISSSTFSAGDAGSVTVNAGDLKIEGMSNITSQANPGSTGNAGTVEVTVDGLLGVLNGAFISSDTYAEGDAGSVTVKAGDLKIEGAEGRLARIASQANPGSTGNAGMVNVSVDGGLELLNFAEISSSTFSAGDAGSVTVKAGDLKIEGAEDIFAGIASQSNPGSTGNAGTVEVTVDGLLELLNGALISSDTLAAGDAGSVTVNAGELRIENVSGILSEAGIGSSGNSGTIVVSVDGQIELLSNDAKIATTTFSVGNAGSIKITASSLQIDGYNNEKNTGVFSRAEKEALGYVGKIFIKTDSLKIQNNGQISIAALNTLPDDRLDDIPDSKIKIISNSMHLDQNGQVTAESKNNVPAAAIKLVADQLYVKNGSSITTTSENADGGTIAIKAETLLLRDGLITTSVEGLSGDGGDIIIEGTASLADVLILDSGFIQANTAAEEASGGNIFIDPGSVTVIAAREILKIGELERKFFEPGSGINIIQAAAPDGNPGNINIAVPELDISGILANLSIDFAEKLQMATDFCQAATGQTPSTLIPVGRGGLPAGPDEPSTTSFGGERLDKLLREEIEKDSSENVAK